MVVILSSLLLLLLVEDVVLLMMMLLVGGGVVVVVVVGRNRFANNDLASMSPSLGSRCLSSLLFEGSPSLTPGSGMARCRGHVWLLSLKFCSCMVMMMWWWIPISCRVCVVVFV